MKYFVVRSLRSLAPVCLLLAVGTLNLTAQSNGVLREVYPGIQGTTVAELTNSPAFPGNPTTVEVLPTFEAPTDVDENYGQRLSAYLLAPTTGNYVFWIASDDNSVLRLSTDSDPAHVQVIASVPDWTSPREWGKFAQQTSANIPLVGGQKYYIEALMKEGGGGDNLAVRWQLPGGTIEEPIPNNRLQVFGLTPPQITQQPADVTVTEGGTASFTVQLARAYGASYQWRRGGNIIPGATQATYTLAPVAVTDNGAQFSCSITNAQGGTNSASATLHVNSDITPPTILSVVNLGDNSLVTVLFSEPIEAASGTAKSNYAIDQGVTISSAAFGGDTRSVVLRTSTLSPGITYQLTVNNVRDLASAPNTIAANTKKTFNLDFTPLALADLGLPREPLGPSSRRTGLVISEIMYHPTNRPDGKVLEFVELYNSQVFPEKIGGYRLSGDVAYTFPPNTTLPAGGFLVVAPVPADVQSVYGISGVLGGFTNRLASGSGTIRLRNNFNAVLLEANFSGGAGWPAAADGAGHSLVLARPSYGEGQREAWEASDLVGGTPGTAEVAGANPYQNIVINEFLAHTDEPDVDYIELYNYGPAAVNLTGCILSDDAVSNKFVLPAVSIPAKGFLVYDQATLGFALSAAGETIYFKNPAGTRVVDAISFKGQENGVATGRYPDGAPGFQRLLTKTPGSSNSKPRVSDVVLNEIMYNPISGSTDDEYVELYNRGAAPVDLGGWKLSAGISFTIPNGTVLSPGGYLVVASKAAHLLANYPGLSAAQTVGDFSGSLSNGGERLALTRPDEVASTNSSGALGTNTIQITMDEVTYRTGGRWGKWSDGDGSSLELLDPHSDHRLAPNWGDSNEGSKSGWTTIEYTGVLDNGNGAADSFQIFLQGAGECLVDDVEVTQNGGPNLIANPSFESGFNDWFPQGTHDQSYWQSSGGFGGGKCLHLVASGRGDTGANRVRATLTSALAPGNTATLRAKVRWLKGDPEILLRLHGNWLEAFGNILTAQNLGTPGAANSRALSNAGPAIHDVTHNPIFSASGQAVTVRAQVNDPDGLGSLVLKYRVDPGTNYTTVSMTYNGAGAYSAVIPGQASGALVAFQIQAADAATPPVVSTFPNDAPARECLVRFGEANPNTGRVGTYHFWITQATNQRWSSREKNSNEPLDATFVYGNSRVIYNIGALYSGSPWHTPGYNGPLNNICDYVLQFADDDLLLGAKDFVLASLGNLNSDPSAQREQAAFWMLGQLGVPTLYRRHINLLVNGNQRGLLYEDAQQPNSDILDEWFADDPDGDLHKIEDWFEFDNSGDVKLFNVDATLQDFTTTGGAKKLARYRWNWRKRAVSNSAHDYTQLFNLVDAANASQPEPFSAQIQLQMDFAEWTRVWVVEHSVGNWDSYGYSRGKNMYGYKPQNGRWNLLPWDIDFVLDNGGDGPTTDMNPATMPINDPVVRRLLTYPFIQRAWWQAVQDLVNGPMLSANISAMMNDKYNGLLAAGIPVDSPSGALGYVASRRAYLQGLLNNVASTFTLNATSFSTNRNFVTLSGTAPIAVTTLKINGVDFPATWTSLSTWTVKLALSGGANALTISGYDENGILVPASTANITITYTGATELAPDKLVINEIMYNSAVPNATFIEIYNKSDAFAFDLSGFELHGADFTFPGGTVIAPNGFLVIVGNAATFVSTYGNTIPLAGVFLGKLQNSGETLRLVRPGASPAQDLVIDEVTYDSAPPWPATANGFGPSLQLVDPYQDNNRVLNWAVAATNTPPPTPQWQYVTVTGTASSSRLYVYLNASGDLYLDDFKLVAGAVPEVGQNYIQNGDFESTLTGPWNTTANTTASHISTTAKHSGVSSLHLFCNAGGTTQGDSLWQNTSSLVNGNPYTLSFWFLQTTTAGTLTVRLSGNGVRVDQNIQLPTGGGGSLLATPGRTNSVYAPQLNYPTVWLNEVQPNNTSGPLDNFAERDPWVELYNSGSMADLTGYYLSDSYTNLLKWPFPAATSLGASGFKVIWLDGQPGQTSGANLHASFRAAGANGSVILTRVNGPTTNIVDYLNYGTVNDDRSYGAFPDGSPAGRHLQYYATPGAANNDTWPAAPAVINEWMASNTRTLANPLDGKFNDWFELYNAGPTAADLTGYYLSNDLTNKTKFAVPSGYSIPAHGFLLVWADNNSSQNSPGDPGLHVNFKLSKSGEAIALFTPDGTLVDGVTFGGQTDDISQGRWPDGNAGQYYFMTNATPGTPNTLGASANHAPVLATIADQSAYQGTALNFTAQATDTDPGQALTYSLDPGAPPAATINPSSGVFSWTPTSGNPPGLYVVTVRVTDNGSPQLSDAKPVNITVSSIPPLILEAQLNQNGGLVLNWATQPQKTYRITYKASLADASWTTLTELTATGTELSITDDTTAAQQRFYRVELVNP